MIELTLYPKKITLRDGTALTLRPMVPEDETALLSFFLTVPEADRWYLKEDVTSPRVIQQWAARLDYRQALPLLAVTDDGAVIADAVLIRRRGGARAHIGEIRVVVAPAFRQRGLGVELMRELCDIANDAGLEKVVAEMVVGAEDDAIKAAEWVGFYRHATLEAMVKDRSGHDCDLAIMEMPMGRYYDWSKF